jgi:hypothetical protein
VSKKLLIITAILGLAGFAGMFAFAWFTNPDPVAQVPEGDPSADGLILGAPQVPELTNAVKLDSALKKTLTEKKLSSLIYEVREKIQEYDNKLESLNVREQRQQVAHESLKRDIDKLNSLQVDLASTIAQLKNEQDKLLEGRIKIAKNEKKNLISIALAYDKMDSTSAGKILTDINRVKNDSATDAVKILYYMTERTKAKVLASIAETEPAISAYFCQKLKKMVENE